ncbi:diaminopimelate epimerase [Candidatus Desantisbacteria bacterium]|nr:diaminopimelate epimerase [Candidatus Desantisbacteria bacterium]
MIPFIKMCASGNDFIVINNMDHGIRIDPSIVRRWCDRKRGIGADGVLVLEPSSHASFKMRIINADGSEAEMCGNGARCIARYAYLKGITDRIMSFETLAGMINAEVIGEQIKIQLTRPTDIRLNMKIDDYPSVHQINTGVPHAVLLVDAVDAIDVVSLGRAIRYHQAFQPAGTNVNFVEVIDESYIKVRTYERGVEDETLACGTGSSASACICSILSKVSSPVRVITKGGEVLTIYLKQAEGNITSLFLEGEANVIFEGGIS